MKRYRCMIRGEPPQYLPGLPNPQRGWAELDEAIEQAHRIQDALPSYSYPNHPRYVVVLASDLDDEIMWGYPVYVTWRPGHRLQKWRHSVFGSAEA